MSGKVRAFLVIACVGALLGLVYSAFSTADFVAHLDRQLHPLHCSLVPGLAEAEQLGEQAQGCQAALFSAYSSLWRQRYWGGVPISLFGLGLFGFGLALSLWGLLTGRGDRGAPLVFLVGTGGVAVGTSLVMFVISMAELGSVCTLCVGTYVGSGVLLLGGVLTLLAARGQPAGARGGPAYRRWRSSWDELADDDDPSPADGGDDPRVDLDSAAREEELAGLRRDGSQVWLGLLLAAQLGVAVFLPAVIYVTVLPDYSRAVRSCGTLELRRPKRNDLLLRLPASAAGPQRPALLVLDPLCPACRAFHERMAASELAGGLAYEVLLLPLDSDCNWMLQDSLHPGACLLSKALLCAGADAPRMLEAIYAQQKELLADSAAKQPDRMRARLAVDFPAAMACADRPEATIRLNRALHFAVQNALPVLTPQLYIEGQRLCDEDTDLGLDYTLAELLGPSPQGAGAPPPATRGRQGAPGGGRP